MSSLLRIVVTGLGVLALVGGCSSGTGGSRPGSGGTGGSSGGGSGGFAGAQCQGTCLEPGATCTIDPPPGSDAPSILCNCTARFSWCCANDTDCGAGGTGGAGGAGGTGGSTSVNLDDLGSPCTAGACPAGLTPVTYCGFAGCTQGSFCSCEITCDEDPNACPAGSVCATISDGAGTVCVKA